MSSIRSVALALALAMATSAPVAAENGTLAIVSVASVDQVLGSVAYLAEVVDAGQMDQMLGAMAGKYTAGLDTGRPIGIVVTSDGQAVGLLGAIPVKNLSQFLAGLKELVGDPRDAGNGVLELAAGPMPVYVKENSGWAFVAQTAEALANLPADPLANLQGLNEQYDIAFRGLIQNIPQFYRQMVLQQIKRGVNMQMQALPQESGLWDELQKIRLQSAIEQWETLLEEGDVLTMGWRVDQNAKKVYLDLSMTAVPGTKTAQQMALLQNAKSKFAGFALDDAAITVNSVTPLVEEDINRMQGILLSVKDRAKEEIAGDEQLADETSKQAAQDLLDRLFLVLEETVKSGQLDGGGSVLTAGDSLEVIAGIKVADNQQVQQAVTGFMEMLTEQQSNAGQPAAVKFYPLSIPIGDIETLLQAPLPMGGFSLDQVISKKALGDVFGDSLDMVVGIAPGNVYLGIGKGSDEHLRQAIEGSSAAAGAPARPFHTMVSLNRVMAFAAKLSQDETVSAIADALQNAEDDHIYMTGTPLENGARYRVEIEEGVLRSAGQARQGAVGAGAGF